MRTVSSSTKSGLVIGFADQFYTLWSVSDINAQGEKEAYYQKNISNDREIVKSQYPNLPIYGELRGEQWIPFQGVGDGIKVEDPSLFRFGKYKGEKIEECEDISYVEWYYKETGNLAAKDLLLQDERFEEWEGRVYLKEDISSIKRILTIKKGGEFKLMCVANGKNNYGEENPMMIAVCEDEDQDVSDWKRGFEIPISTSFEKSWVEKNYQGFYYHTLQGCRTMKNQWFNFTINEEGYIVDMQKVS